MNALGNVYGTLLIVRPPVPATCNKAGANYKSEVAHTLYSPRRAYREWLSICDAIVACGGYSLDISDNPHPWEGMADVAVVGDRAVLTYAVPGHYDEGVEPKSRRSSREGVSYAAEHAGVPADARVLAELVYPHFHGDTVHFGVRPTNRAPALVHYPGGLWGELSSVVRDRLGADNIVEIGRDDAVEQYAGNSRQVGDGVLIPDRVSTEYARTLVELGLTVHAVPLFELFGKAGGGPACATLYMPSNLELPADAPIRYSVRRDEAHARADRIAETLTVHEGYFDGKARG